MDPRAAQRNLANFAIALSLCSVVLTLPRPAQLCFAQKKETQLAVTPAEFNCIPDDRIMARHFDPGSFAKPSAELTKLANQLTFKLDADQRCRLSKQVLQMQKAELGSDHPLLIPTYAYLMNAYFEKGLKAEARKTIHQLIALQSMWLGELSIDTVDSYVRLSFSSSNESEREETALLIDSLLKKLDSLAGRHFQAKAVLNFLRGQSLTRKGRLEEALCAYQAAYEAERQTAGAVVLINRTACLDLIARTQRDLGRESEYLNTMDLALAQPRSSADESDMQRALPIRFCENPTKTSLVEFSRRLTQNAQHITDYAILSWAWLNLADAAQERQELDSCIKHAESLLSEIDQSQPHSHWICSCNQVERLAIYELLLGNKEKAAKLCGQARHTGRHPGPPDQTVDELTMASKSPDRLVRLIDNVCRSQKFIFGRPSKLLVN